MPVSEQAHLGVAIRGVIIDLCLHVFSGVVFAILIYTVTRNLIYAGIFMFGAVLVDVDHLIDDFVYQRNQFCQPENHTSSNIDNEPISCIRPSLGRLLWLGMYKFHLGGFLSCCYLDSGRVYLLLHSWEMNFLILVGALIMHSPALWILFWGLSIHLTIDNLQRRKPFFYFITYRLCNKFNADILLPEYKIRVSQLEKQLPNS